MKVKELIGKLGYCDPNMEIYMSRDAEGNGFNLLQGVDNTMCYNAKTEEMGIKKLIPEAKKSGYTEEDVVKGKACVVFWA